MKVFLDTEFTSLDINTKLISLALVSEDNRKFYAEFVYYNYDKLQVSDWVKENVIDNLILIKKFGDVGFLPENIILNDDETKILSYDFYIRDNTEMICAELKRWVKQFDEIEIWGDCISYDWVLFCDLFGGAFNIPKNIYYIPFDIATLFKIKGINPDITREYFILDTEIQGVKHNALYDVEVIKACYDKLMKL